MNPSEVSTGSAERTEVLLRVSRGSLFFVLFLIAVLGATAVSMAIRPDAPLANWPSRLPWLLPLAIIAALAVQRTKLGRLASRSEMAALMSDEWRRLNMDRARRFALAIVLVGQVPLALAFAGLPSLRAVLGMAAATITLGMAALIASFLVFDRE